MANSSTSELRVRADASSILALALIRHAKLLFR